MKKRNVFCIVGVLAAAWVLGPASADAVLVRASYDFNDSATPTDGSGNGYHGTYHGSIWTSSMPAGHTSAGAIGPAFSSTNYASLPGGAFSPLPKGMVEAWVYFDPAVFHGGEIVDFLRDSTGLHFGITTLDNGEYHLQARVGNAGVNDESIAVMPQDVWTKVAVSWNGEDLKFFINGVEDSSYPHTEGLSGTGTAYVGRISDDDTWNFQGYIDDLVISDLSINPPSAPLHLTAATGTGPGEIDLDWDAPASDGGSAVTNYRIYRGTSPGGESFVTQVGNVTSYADTGLPGDTRFYYKVSAVNAAGEGPLSNEATAKTCKVQLVFQHGAFVSVCVIVNP